MTDWFLSYFEEGVCVCVCVCVSVCVCIAEQLHHVKWEGGHERWTGKYEEETGVLYFNLVFVYS